jgi:hypothetical protein
LPLLDDAGEGVVDLGPTGTALTAARSPLSKAIRIIS